MVQVYSLNLSTAITTGNYACTLLGTNYANVMFNINWDNLFKGKTGEAQLKFKLCSKSSNSYSFNSDLGYVQTIGIASPYSNSCNLGMIIPNNDTTSNYTSTTTTGTTTYTAQNNYLFGTSFDTDGITVKIPQGITPLQIQLLDISNTLMPITDPYFIWLYFETD